MSATQLNESKKCRTIFVERSNELKKLNKEMQEAVLYEEIVPFIDQQIDNMGVHTLSNLMETENTLGIDIMDELKSIGKVTENELDILEAINLDMMKYSEKLDEFYSDVSVAIGYFYAKEYNSYLDKIDTKDMDFYDNLEALNGTLNIAPTELAGFMIEVQSSINALTEVSQKYDCAINVYDTLDAALKEGYLAAIKNEAIDDYISSIKDTSKLIDDNRLEIIGKVSDETLLNLDICEEKLKIIEKEIDHTKSKEVDHDDLSL